MPNKISLGIATKQWGNISGLVLGLEKKDYKLIFRSVQDFIAEPIRSKFIPNFNSIKNILKRCPENGFGISGSGPTCFALTKGEKNADIIKNELLNFSNKKKINLTIYISKVNNKGVKILS